MKHVPLIVVSMFLLGASPPSVDTLVLREGGLWELSYSYDLKALDEATRQIFEQSLSDQPSTERVCEKPLTTANYPKPGEPFSGKNYNNCRYDQVEVPGKPVLRKVTCKASIGPPLKLTMSGTISPRAYKITTTSSVEGMQLSGTETGKYVGSC